MRDQLLEGVAALRDAGRVLGGVASVESPSGDVVTVRALTRRRGRRAGRGRAHRRGPGARRRPAVRRDRRARHRGGRQGHLRHDARPQRHRSLLGQRPAPTSTSPRVAMIVLLGLTAVTAGNVTGIGFVDFVPVALAEQIDWEQTYVNSFTAGGAGRAAGPDADGAARRGVVHPGRPADVRQAVRRPEEGRAHPLDAAPHPLLGERRAARRAPCGRAGRRRRRVARRARHVLHRRAPRRRQRVVHPDRPRPRAVGPRRLPRRPADRAARAGARAGGARACGWPGSPSTSGAPVPMAGFTIVAEVTRAGRATANTSAAIVDGDGKVRVTATGMHLAVGAGADLRGPPRQQRHGDATARRLRAGRVPGRAGRPRLARVPRRGRDPLPAGRGQRARAPRRCGCAPCRCCPTRR